MVASAYLRWLTELNNLTDLGNNHDHHIKTTSV